VKTAVATREPTWLTEQRGDRALALAPCRRHQLLQPTPAPRPEIDGGSSRNITNTEPSAHVEITCRDAQGERARARASAIPARRDRGGLEFEDSGGKWCGA